MAVIAGMPVMAKLAVTALMAVITIMAMMAIVDTMAIPTLDPNFFCALYAISSSDIKLFSQMIEILLTFYRIKNKIAIFTNFYTHFLLI